MSRGEGLGYFVEMVPRRLAGGRAGAAARVRRARVDGRQELPRDHRRLARALPLRTGAIRRGRGVRRRLRAVGGQELGRRTGSLEGGARRCCSRARGDVEAGEALAREAVDLALRTDRVDTQTDALMDLAEVLRHRRPRCRGRADRRGRAAALRAEGGPPGRSSCPDPPTRAGARRGRRDLRVAAFTTPREAGRRGRLAAPRRPAARRRSPRAGPRAARRGSARGRPP